MAVFLCVIVAGLPAQNRLRATGNAPFFKEPGGIRLGALVTGASYPVGRSNGDHREITLEGWIPAASAEPTTRDGFDLTVTSGGGEPLRGAPSGSVIARLVEGTLLTKVGTRGSWIQVRRSGWVGRTSLATPETTVPPPPAPAAVVSQPPAAPTTRPTPAATTPAVGPPPAPAPVPAAVAPRTDARDSGNVSAVASLKAGASVALTPDGMPVLTVAQVTDADVLERNRDWVKVRVEGWVRIGEVASESSAGPRVTGAMIRQDPDKFVGSTVAWRIQFLSIQQADALRPEMPAGQTYILARGPLPESGFTYLMVTKDQAAHFRRLAPLDEVHIEAVIRAGRTKFLPTPVLELTKVAQ